MLLEQKFVHFTMFVNIIYSRNYEVNCITQRKFDLTIFKFLRTKDKILER